MLASFPASPPQLHNAIRRKSLVHICSPMNMKTKQNLTNKKAIFYKWFIYCMFNTQGIGYLPPTS